MAHPLKHAQSSARKFGGRAEDYLPIHNWLMNRRHSSEIFATGPYAITRLCRSRYSGIHAERRIMPSGWGGSGNRSHRPDSLAESAKVVLGIKVAS